jgi:hypothetical protein
MAFDTALAVRTVRGQPHRWELEEPLAYRDSVHGAIVVLPGARTDGASVPRLLWTLVGSPMRDSRVLRAAVVHDQLYCTFGGAGALTRTQCDALFYRALRAAGVGWLKARAYYLGVRAGGWVGWRRYAQDPSSVARELQYLRIGASTQPADAARNPYQESP